MSFMRIFILVKIEITTIIFHRGTSYFNVNSE